MLKDCLKSLLFCISVFSVVCLLGGVDFDLWLLLIVSTVVLWPLCYDRYG